MLVHDGVDDEAGRGDSDEDRDDEAADEEGDVPACLFGGLGDAEGVDERVGEEVEKSHGGFILRPKRCEYRFASVLAGYTSITGSVLRAGRGGATLDTLGLKRRWTSWQQHL